MTKDELIMIGMLAVGTMILLPMMTRKATAAPAARPTGNQYGASEIMRADGWTYYTDGTAIDPDGVYYYQGAQVYDPKGMYGKQ